MLEDMCAIAQMLLPICKQEKLSRVLSVAKHHLRDIVIVLQVKCQYFWPSVVLFVIYFLLLQIQGNQCLFGIAALFVLFTCEFLFEFLIFHKIRSSLYHVNMDLSKFDDISLVGLHVSTKLCCWGNAAGTYS
uniref:TEX10-like TPR repeats domain-containing protein n=1 Tax=Physcomitrium patens TaxID=3218 RepID=A0A7I3Z2Y9_PHYPA